MGTANKIPAFRPIQPAKLSAEHEVSAIHAGHVRVKVAGLNQDQIVHGSRGQNDKTDVDILLVRYCAVGGGVIRTFKV